MDQPTPQKADAPATPASAASSAPAGEKKPGLEGESNTLALQALQQFRAGLSQALLYSLETKQFEKAAENACAPIKALMDVIGGFTLVVSPTDALINGTRVELPPAMKTLPEALDKMMTAAGLSSLQFDRELTALELGKFMQLLSRKRLSGDGAKINKFLKEQEIEHVHAGELRYVAIGATDRVIGKDVVIGAPGLSNAAAQGAAIGIAAGFMQTAQRVEDPIAREQLRAEMIEQLIEKDEGMLGNLLITASQRLRDPANEKYRELVALPRRDGQTLQQVLQLSKLAVGKGLTTDDPMVGALRELVVGLVTPYKSRAEDLLVNVPFDEETAGLLPEWLVQSYASLKGGSAAERLEGILSQSPNALLDEDMFMQIVDVLDELTVAGMEAESQRLATHVAGALRAVTKAERSKAVQRTALILQHSLEQASPAVQTLESALLEACTHETCDEVLQLLLSHLSSRCVHHYRLGNLARAQEHLRWIGSLEESSRVAMRDEGANLARHAREELARTDFGTQLAQELLQETDTGLVALEMARVLGKDVWGQLADRLRTERDPNAQATLTRRLATFGKEGVQLFFSLLSKEQDGPTVLRMLGIAPLFNDEAQVAALVPGLLRHKDEGVRLRALQMLMQRSDASSAQTLVGLLHEEADAARRKTYLNCLAQLNDHSGFDALVAELESARGAAQPDEAYLVLLLETITATAKPEAVAPVSKLLGGMRGRTLLGAGEERIASKTVACAAIRTLARFYKDPPVAEVLERLRKDKDPEVSRVALVALRGLVAAELQQADARREPALPPLPPPGAPSPAPAPASKRRPHRAFEVLEEQIRVDNVFKVGAGVGGAAPAPGGAGSASGSGETRVLQAGRSASSSRIALKGIKPVIEGVLQDLGLARTLIMLRGRDGVMKIELPGGASGLIYIKDRKIVSAGFGDKLDLEALALLDGLQAARFAYYVNMGATQATLSLDPADLRKMLADAREQQRNARIM